MSYTYRPQKAQDKGYVFFDFDDFLFKTNHTFIRFVYDFFEIIITEQEMAYNQDWYHFILSRIPKKKASMFSEREDFWIYVREHYLNSLEYHEDVVPMQGVLDIVPSLSEDYRLVIVTNRNRECLDTVEYVLQKHLPECFELIHFVYNGPQIVANKPDFISNFECKLPKFCFFDDHIKEVETVGKVIPSYLFDPENHHHTSTLKKDGRYVDSWYKIPGIIALNDV